MDDAPQVSGVETVGNLLRDRECLIDRYGTSAEALRQVLALDELHDQRPILDPVYVRDMRMIQRRQQLGLALKTRQPVSIRGHVDWQYLDRDVALQSRVMRTIDLSHAARTNVGQDFVWADARTRAKSH
jgi:hypothetical protein